MSKTWFQLKEDDVAVTLQTPSPGLYRETPPPFPVTAVLYRTCTSNSVKCTFGEQSSQLVIDKPPPLPAAVQLISITLHSESVRVVPDVPFKYTDSPPPSPVLFPFKIVRDDNQRSADASRTRSAPSQSITEPPPLMFNGRDAVTPQLFAVKFPVISWMGTGSSRGLMNAATASTAYFRVAQGAAELQIPESCPLIEMYRVVILPLPA